MAVLHPGANDTSRASAEQVIPGAWWEVATDDDSGEQTAGRDADQRPRPEPKDERHQHVANAGQPCQPRQMSVTVCRLAPKRDVRHGREDVVAPQNDVRERCGNRLEEDRLCEKAEEAVGETCAPVADDAFDAELEHDAGYEEPEPNDQASEGVDHL